MSYIPDKDLCSSLFIIIKLWYLSYIHLNNKILYKHQNFIYIYTHTHTQRWINYALIFTFLIIKNYRYTQN